MGAVRAVFRPRGSVHLPRPGPRAIAWIDEQLTAEQICACSSRRSRGTVTIDRAGPGSPYQPERTTVPA